MKAGLQNWVILLGLFGAISAQAESVQIQKLEFIAVTNVKMFKFTGAAKDFPATIERKGNELSSFELKIPVQDLKTGMDIRDKHMRERIFTANDGKVPEIVFKGEKSECRPEPSASVQTCLISGKLAFRGQENRYKFSLTLKNGKSIEGNATIDVTSFGVNDQALSYSKVKVNKDVQVHFEAILP